MKNTKHYERWGNDIAEAGAVVPPSSCRPSWQFFVRFVSLW